MKAFINDNDELVIDCEDLTERFALRCWYQQNPLTPNDGVKLLLNCWLDEKSFKKSNEDKP